MDVETGTIGDNQRARAPEVTNLRMTSLSYRVFRIIRHS